MENIKNEKYSLDIYLEEIKNHDILNKNEQIELIKKYKNGDSLARDKLLQCNLKLVIDFAKKYINKGVDICDLIQEGNLGLMKAIEKFDLKYECKFSTYASWWIRQHMARSISNSSRTIRLPVYIRDAIIKLERNKKIFINKKNCEPTIKDLSNMTGFTVEKITKLMDVFRDTETISLNDPIFLNLDKKNNIMFNDIISDNEEIKNIDKKKIFDKIIKKIRNIASKRNKEIFTERIGLNNNKINIEKTLKTVGNDYDLTRERIRQIVLEINEEIRKDKELMTMFKSIINK